MSTKGKMSVSNNSIIMYLYCKLTIYLNIVDICQRYLKGTYKNLKAVYKGQRCSSVVVERMNTVLALVSNTTQKFLKHKNAITKPGQYQQ